MRCACSSLLAALILPLLAGCKLHMDLPQEFLELDRSGSQLRATTPQDACLLVRTFDDSSEGTTTFWAEALRNDLVERRGYVLVEEAEVADGDGNQGRLAIYRTRHDGEQVGYLTALWVDSTGMFGNGRQVRIAEFIAPKDEFDQRLPEVRRSLSSLRP